MKDAKTGLHVPYPAEPPQRVTPDVLEFVTHPEFRRDINAAIDRWGQIDWDQSAELTDLIVAKIVNWVSGELAPHEPGAEGQ